MAEGLPYLNKVFIIGNLVRDPALSYTPSGTAVCKMSVAINRRYKVNNEWQDDVVFMDIVVWGKLGENSQKYLSKGKKVFIEGRLSQNRWTAQDGSNRSKIEVIAEKVQFLSSPELSGEKAELESQSASTPEGEEGHSIDSSSIESAFSNDVPF